MIVATAGHIDHGKTSLVRALTGVDADRLPEEKRRGMTIDLGFAYMTGPSATRIGFIDVPGHERFVRAMLAGVTGVDMALLVIAADDGVMPQTREHLAILNLLDAPVGAIVINKTDLANKERIDRVIEDIKNLTVGGPLENSPVFPVSSISGDGIEALRGHLHQTAKSLIRPPAEGRFRLAVDRVFQMRGVGLIVTGSAYAGAVKIGDKVCIAPSGKQVRVRGIHAQNLESHAGRDGERLAINISGVSLEDVSRGDWLVAEEALLSTSRLDVNVTAAAKALDGKGFQDGQKVHFHHGSADIPGRILLLEHRNLEPGQSAFARVILEKTIPAVCWERFVIRDQQAKSTLGGGRILDPAPPYRRWRVKNRFIALNTADPDLALSNILGNGSVVDWLTFSKSYNLSDAMKAKVLKAVSHIQLGEGIAAILASPKVVFNLQQQILSSLEQWHKLRPEDVGAPAPALRQTLADIPDTRLFGAVIDSMASAGNITRAGGRLALKTHTVQFSDQERKLWNRVEPLLKEGNLRPPRVRELADLIGVDHKPIEALLKRAARMGLVAPVANNRFFPHEAIDELVKIAAKVASKNSDGSFTAQSFKDEAGIGRNVAIEVLEYTDRIGRTVRDGDVRRVKNIV